MLSDRIIARLAAADASPSSACRAPFINDQILTTRSSQDLKRLQRSGEILSLQAPRASSIGKSQTFELRSRPAIFRALLSRTFHLREATPMSPRIFNFRSEFRPSWRDVN